MATRTLLHSGEFTDYNGNKVTVEFYKVYNLYVVPRTIKFGSDGGTQLVTVWSNKGNAYLGDPMVLWLNYRQVSAERLPGSEQFKYTFEITCEPNTTGARRTYVWKAHIDSGEGTGYATNTLQVIQETDSQVTTLSVSPEYLRYNVGGGTSGITVRWTSGPEPTATIAYINGEVGWLTLNGSELLDHQKNWAFTASENDTLIEREAVISVTNGIDVINVPVRQNRQ